MDRHFKAFNFDSIIIHNGRLHLFSSHKGLLNLENQGGGLKIGNPRGKGDKEAKIQGRIYEIKENPRGEGDKEAKIQLRTIKIIEIPKKFPGGEGGGW